MRIVEQYIREGAPDQVNRSEAQTRNAYGRYQAPAFFSFTEVSCSVFSEVPRVCSTHIYR